MELRTQLHGVRDELHALTVKVNAAQARAQVVAARNATLQSKLAVAARLHEATGTLPRDGVSVRRVSSSTFKTEAVVESHQEHLQAMEKHLQSLQDHQHALQRQVTT